MLICVVAKRGIFSYQFIKPCHVFFYLIVLSVAIKKGDELLVSYGSAYWDHEHDSAPRLLNEVRTTGLYFCLCLFFFLLQPIF